MQKLLLEMANERHPRRENDYLFSVIFLLRWGEVVQAIEYYKDFVQIAPMTAADMCSSTSCTKRRDVKGWRNGLQSLRNSKEGLQGKMGP